MVMQRPPKATAISRIQRVQDQIPGLHGLDTSSPGFEQWHRDTRVAITNAFGDHSQQLADFTAVRYSRFMISELTTERDHQEAFDDGLKRAAAILQSIIGEIEEYWEDEST